MDYEDYLAACETLAGAFAGSGQSVSDLIEARSMCGGLVAQAAAFRKDELVDADRRDFGGFLDSGHFARATPDERLALFALTLEVEYAADRQRLRRACEGYVANQPLFQGSPALSASVRLSGKSRRREMIDLGAIRQVDHSEIFKVPGGYAKLPESLPATVVSWTRESFPAAPAFVRLDPYEFHRQPPLRKLNEVTIVPGDPHWLTKFSLRKKMRDQGRYDLLDCEPSEGMGQYWDYRVLGMRRLEFSVERREDNHLTMMIEELPRHDERNGLMVGRCVHLDTAAVAFTDLSKVVLKHLDLALNVYEGDQRRERWEASLVDGKGPDASFRTHLFRVEDVPFMSAFGYAQLFFRSRVLWSEWCVGMGVAPPADPGPPVAP